MLNRDWLRAFLPLGIADNRDWKPVGAGTLVGDGQVIWLVTAAHVVRSAAKGNLSVVVNLKDGGQCLVDMSAIHRDLGLDWQFEEERDLAVGLMPIRNDFDIRGIDLSLLVPFDQILPSMQCLTVGCPYGVAGLDATRVLPLVLDGIIAGVDGRSKRLFVTAPTFPGNSGGPVLLIRPPFSTEGAIVGVNSTVHLAGVISHYSLVRPAVDPTLSQMPPLHLGVATCSDEVDSLLRSEACTREKDKALQRGR